MIGAFTIVYDEHLWLAACAAQLQVFDRVVVVQGTRPQNWVGPRSPNPPASEVEELCRQYGFDHLWCNLSDIAGQPAVGRQRQTGVEHLKALGCKAFAWFAVDELMTVAAAKAVRQALYEDNTKLYIASWVTTLWHNEFWMVGYAKPIPGLPFDVDCDRHERGGRLIDPWDPSRVTHLDIEHWHFAFARPPAEMDRKWRGWGLASINTPIHVQEWNAWSPRNNTMFWPSCHAWKVDRQLPDELRVRLGVLHPALRRYEEDTKPRTDVCRTCGK